MATDKKSAVHPLKIDDRHFKRQMKTVWCVPFAEELEGQI
jgi:hypothetical protein